MHRGQLLIFATTLIVVLAFSRSYGQKMMKGIVVDSDGQPVPYATLVVGDSISGGQVIMGYADSTGQYSFYSEKRISEKSPYIFARFFENESIRYNVRDSLMTIVFSKAVQLKEFTVKRIRPTVVRTADRYIYSPSDLQKGASSSLEILKFAPLIEYDTKSDVFSIVGKENTLITLNGRRTNYPKDMILSFLRSTPSSNIINVEIITNPGSEYSANTGGGIININLKKSVDDGVFGNISFADEQSILNTAILNGNITYRKRKLALRFSPFFNRSFNYRDYKNELQNLNQTIEQTNGRYKRRYFVKGGGIGIDYELNNKALLGINGFVSGVNGRSNQNNTTFYSQNNGSLDSTFQSPVNGKDKYFYNFGNIYFEQLLDTTRRDKIIINIDYNQFRKGNQDHGAFNGQDNGQEAASYLNRYSQRFFNGSTNIDYLIPVNQNGKVNIGVQLSNTNIESDVDYSNLHWPSATFISNKELSGSYRYLERYYSTYATANQTIRKIFNISIGLRLERTNYQSQNVSSRYKIDSIYTNLFPSASFSFTKKDQNFSLSISRKIKRPTFEQLLPGRIYTGPKFFTENNPFLLPVMSYTIDFSYSLKSKYFLSTGYNQYKNQFEQIGRAHV